MRHAPHRSGADLPVPDKLEDRLRWEAGGAQSLLAPSEPLREWRLRAAIPPEGCRRGEPALALRFGQSPHVVDRRARVFAREPCRATEREVEAGDDRRRAGSYEVHGLFPVRGRLAVGEATFRHRGDPDATARSSPPGARPVDRNY